MKRRVWKQVLFSFLFVVMTVVQVSAATFTYDLTRYIEGQTPGDLPYSLGTVEIYDDPNNALNVGIQVDLNTGLNLLRLYLNYVGPTPSSNLALNGETDDIAFHDVKSPGSYKGVFDILLGSHGNLPGSEITHYTGIISDGANNLDASFFNAFDSAEVFHTVAHIGDGSGVLPFYLTSIWAGDGNGTAPVPEPGTMLLLGCGLVVLAIYSKRRSLANV